MKKYVKTIVASSLMATAFGALSIGSTFALFTSQAKTTIEIESGIVDLEQNIEIMSVAELGDVAVVADSNGVYTNSIGGKTYVDSVNQGILHLEKWVPGDKAVIKITNSNHSNVSIKTRFVTEVSQSDDTKPNLDEVLDLTYAVTGATGSPINQSNYEVWTLVEPSVEDLDVILVTIEFPDADNGEIKFDSTDNAYQDGNVIYMFEQQAVQGNAHTVDTSKGYADSYEEEIGGETYEVNELSEPEHFEQMLTDLQAVDPTDADEVEEAQKTIFKLTSDIDMEGSDEINKGILYGTLDGQGHKIENIHYEDPTGTATGLFAKYYDGAKVEDLALDNIEIKGKENVGVLFGQSYPHASGASSTVADTELTIENVTIGSNVSVSGTKGVGGLAGSTRWIEKLTVKNCVNNADISAEIYNVGGFFGTLAGVKTLVLEDCVNNGNIRGIHNVGGFVGQSPALESLTVKNCINHGRIIDFGKHGSESNAGWFVACHKEGAELNYTGNYTDGTIYYVTENASVVTVFEKDLVGDTSEAAIRVDSGKTYADYMKLDDTVVLDYEIVNNQFVVSEVAGADHYTMSMQVWGRDVRLEGNTATVYKEKYLAFTQEFDTVQELHDSFGRITRAGYFLNSVYTQYDYDPTGDVSNSATINGRANFFRLPYAQKGNYSVFNKPYYDATLGEWVFILDGELDCLPGTGHILSPKNTSVTYIITAYDSNNHVIANSIHKDDAAGMNPSNPSDVSGSFLKNMAGDVFWSAGPDTVPGTTVYDPVA